MAAPPEGEARLSRNDALSINHGTPILEVRDLVKTFELPLGLLRVLLRHKADVLTAVDGVSFQVERGQVLGIVGESGCGKTTLLRCIARIYAADSGEIRFEGQNLCALTDRQMRGQRRKIQIVFQDPYSSLNPRLTVGQVLHEILSVHRLRPPDKVVDRMAELVELVGMPPDTLNRRPAQFSGGQRQRIGIARALAMEPTLLLADEPVSALDVSIQAQVLNLLVGLQSRLGLTMLFVTHDLRVVHHVSHRIAVMYLGRIVELGPTDSVFACPVHPYTRALLAAVPELDPAIRDQKPALGGDPPSPIHIPPGCRFHPRCAMAIDTCRMEDPVLQEFEPGHLAACPVNLRQIGNAS